MTRSQMYFSEGSPKRVGEPVPTGWHQQQVASAANSYEHSPSQLRLLHTQDLLQSVGHGVRDTITTTQYDDVVSALPDLWIEEQKWQRKATTEESFRLRSLLSTAPVPRRGQHINQRVLPAVHGHFTTRRAHCSTWCKRMSSNATWAPQPPLKEHLTGRRGHDAWCTETWRAARTTPQPS